MYFAKKSEYNDIREKSFLQWLDEMEKHDDVAVRCGVKLAREYMQYLKDENEKLQEENELKNSYLKKMKMYKLDYLMDGDLFELTAALMAEHQAEQLASLGESV